MSYELKFPPDTQTEISEYIQERFEGKRAQEAALDAILAGLETLCANPGLGSSKPGGPFESRFIYRFGFNIDGTVRYVQVVYKIHKKDRIVVISGFQPLML